MLEEVKIVNDLTIDLTQDIQPLTTFRRRSADFLEQLRGAGFGEPRFDKEGRISASLPLITFWCDVRGLDPRSIFGSANVQSCP